MVENLEKQKNYEIDLLKQELNDYKEKFAKIQIDLKQKETQNEFLENKLKQSAFNGKLLYISFNFNFIVDCIYRF